MKFVKQISFLVLGLCLALSLQAQPKREFRAAWLTTVWAIDWPTPHSSSTASGQQKQQDALVTLVDKMANANMNAVFFQVRGFCDAMYKSQYEPWSKYLTGTRGGEPTYDPLQLIIDSAHARGMEVHAWLNPYRYASSDETYGKDDPKDYHNTHPEWLVNCEGITILNPSLPETREQICKVVADIVTNYDVDGVIFDDYFHQSGYKESYDEEQYKATGNGMKRADWRRAQNNLMVEQVNNTIKKIKPWVKFGIGPAGVAGKANTSAPVYGVEPCPTPSSDWQYNQIYADPLAWYNEKTIDYMAPQIYWTIDSWSNYDVIAKWWSDMAYHFERHMYVSHTLQNLLPDYQALTNGKHHADEIGAQTALNRLYDRMGAPGSCWYALSTGITTMNFMKYITTEVYTNHAVVPQMTWYRNDDCIYVSNIAKQGNTLTWKAPKENLRYAVYAMPQNAIGKIGTIGYSDYLLGTSYTNSFDVTGVDASYTYAVAVLDRYGNEYPARTMGNTQWGKSAAAQLLYPANNAKALVPCDVRWKHVSGADSYFFQLSKSADFATVDYEIEVVDTAFYLGKIYQIGKDSVYHWRVRTRSVNKEDAYSDVYHFEAAVFRMQSPAEGDTTDFAPTFVCDSVAYPVVEYTFEVATNTSFDDIVYTGVSNAPRHTMTENLLASRNYYVRVTAKYSNGSVMSDFVQFRTKPQDVPVPVILSPKNGTSFAGEEVMVTWKEQPSSGFQVECSTERDFPSRGLKKVRISETDVFSCTITKLKAGTWYIRVKAAKEGGWTEPSEVVTVYTGGTASVEDLQVETTPTKIVENGHVYIQRNGKRYNLLGAYAQ